MVEIEEHTNLKKNNLNTKFLPPIFMLVAGLVAFIVGIYLSYSITRFLATIFISMLVFAIIGTIVKTVVDSFNMKLSYEDFFEDEDGEIREK